MKAQLMKMWEIQEQSNQSHSQDDHLGPFSKNVHVHQALNLRKLNQDTMGPLNTYQLDLQEYLTVQRANTSAYSHQTNKKPKLTPEEKEMSKTYEDNYGKGFKMLKGMGFNLGKGLGKQQQGRTKIVEAEFKTSLTARNEDQKPQSDGDDQNEKSEQSDTEEIEQENLEQIFLYRSQDPKINSFMSSIKNAYQILQTKLSIANRQVESIEREIEFTSDYKLQKQNQINELDRETQGLESLSNNIYKVNKFPELGLKYNIDLLIVKNAIQKVSVIPIQVDKNGEQIGEALSKVVELLTEMYLQKQRAMLRQYSNNNSEIFMNFPKGLKQSNKRSSDKDEMVTMSEQDEKRIHKYLSIIIDSGIVKNRLQKYLSSKKSIDECQMWGLDVIEVIKKYDQVGKQKGQSGEIITRLKQKYLIPLCNNYLKKSLAVFKSDNMLMPNHVIFPWLSVIRLNQLDINGFIYRVVAKPWRLDEDRLYHLISPWIQYIDSQAKTFLITLYLAPKLLYQMEHFKISTQNSRQDQKKKWLKHFMLYSTLLPPHIKQQILKNSIGMQVYTTYRKFFESSTSQKEREQAREWAGKWGKQMDKFAKGVIQNIFREQGIDINWK